MTTWKDGGYHGARFGHDIINEEKGRIICRVFTKQVGDIGNNSGPWPEGEANFRLILKAPRMLEALNMIAEGAIVSPNQPPEKIAEQVLRVLQITQEAHLALREITSTRQKRIEQMLEALEAIQKTARRIVGDMDIPTRTRSDWRLVERHATAAIAAAKGENDDGIN